MRQTWRRQTQLAALAQNGGADLSKPLKIQQNRLWQNCQSRFCYNNQTIIMSFQKVQKVVPIGTTGVFLKRWNDFASTDATQAMRLSNSFVRPSANP